MLTVYTVFCFLVSAGLLTVGVFFVTGKAPQYIKGYREMPEEEKKNINVKALCQNVSVLFFVMTAVFLAAGIFPELGARYLKWALVGWLVLCCADILYIGKSKRYEKKKPAAKKRR